MWSKLSTSRFDFAAQAILYVAVAGVFGVFPALVTRDLNWCYSYMGPDSWDWLVNGLYWSGAPVTASFRPPGLPLVIAMLHRLSALPLLPFLNFAMFGLAAALLHRFVRLRHSALVAALAVLLFVSNGSLFGYARYVMAEVWTLPFLLGAAIAFVGAQEAPRKYFLCALLLSLGFLFHYAAAVVGLAFAVVLLLYRRATLATRTPWLALLTSTILPVLWVVARAVHNRARANGHNVEGLVDPSLHNVRYFAVVAVALVGVAALPLYLAGFARLLPRRGRRLDPWAQVVLFPLLSLALFFSLVYDWTDKRFLYYLFPFAIAVAAEGLAALADYARGGRLRTAVSAVALGIVLLWNRIPYPDATHTLVALTPRSFLDAAHGVQTAKMVALPSGWSLSLFTSDGFFAYDPPSKICAAPSEQAAVPAMRELLDGRLRPGEAIALASNSTKPETYWLETNRLSFALERPIVKPGEALFLVRPLLAPDPRALTTIGPFELFDLKAIGAAE